MLATATPNVEKYIMNQSTLSFTIQLVSLLVGLVLTKVSYDNDSDDDDDVDCCD